MSEEASVLIVDGNVHMTTMLERFFARHAVSALAVMSVAEAWAMVGQYTFEVVLTDLFLPRGEGLKLLRYIRQTAPGTRVIVMAAFGAPEMCQNALAEGAHAFLVKPFTLHYLWSLVQEVLGTSGTSTM